MKKAIYFTSLVIAVAITIVSCGGASTDTADNNGKTVVPKSMIPDPPKYDPNRGEGKFNHVDIGEKLDEAVAKKGEDLFGVKCGACHKLTDEKLVGPGWKGVTERRKPEWIMNFITNPDAMMDKDPAVQQALEICLVRMPNQSLTDDDARDILEFMRKNDGVK
jgi:hypothetical protein